MKVLIEIDEKFYQWVKMCGIMPFITAGKVIPDNATNGDVIKALFPNYKFKDSCGWVNIYIGGEYGESYSFCPDKFWDAPYKGGE